MDISEKVGVEGVFVQEQDEQTQGGRKADYRELGGENTVESTHAPHHKLFDLLGLCGLGDDVNGGAEKVTEDKTHQQQGMNLR